MQLQLKTIKTSAVIVVLLALCSNVHAIKIAISHLNDVNGQMDSFVKGSQWGVHRSPIPCSGLHQCIGGFTSILHWLNEKNGFGFEDVRSTNILRLSSGNVASEQSGWLPSMDRVKNHNGWRDYGYLIREYFNLTALTLGMRDFESGLTQTQNFLYATDDSNNIFTLANVCWQTNYNDTMEGEFCRKIVESRNVIKRIKVTDVDSVSQYSIGVIGFVTPLVERLSSPGKLKFDNVVKTIKEASANSDMKTIIAIGDSDGDLALAKGIIDQVPKVKLVLISSGFTVGPNMTDKYPLPYKQGFIATAGRYGSSIGKLLLDLDTNSGDITVLNATLAETTIPEKWNAAAQRIINTLTRDWGVAVNNQKFNSNKQGQTRVDLPGQENCWREECNLGNLVTDAMVHCIQDMLAKPFQFPIHSVWHGGAFSKDIFKAGRGIGLFDIFKWLPYPNNVHFVRVQGHHLWKLFEQSATGINPSKTNAKEWGQFLQVSNGIQVYYDFIEDTPILTRIRIQHDVNGVPKFGELQENSTYYLAISTYLYEGRGVYEFARSIWENVTEMIHPALDDECVGRYTTALEQVSVGIEERIHISKNGGYKISAGILTGSRGKVLFVGATILIARLIKAVQIVI